MSAVYMEKRDPPKNQFRFYEVDQCMTLFGNAAVVFRFGRIGTNGRIQYQWYPSLEEAEQERLMRIERKRRRGYEIVTPSSGCSNASMIS